MCIRDRNIVCFPEKMDLNILGKIMQGGADKVIEAGGTLAGGHSIACLLYTSAESEHRCS